MSDITYQFEYDQLIPCAFIGAGGHSYRNVYPTFQYAPVDLRAVCDVNETRAKEYARKFGASRAYSDHREMLAREKPTAVFIVTSYDKDGRVQATDLALDCLEAGAHVWMEKPTASSVAEIRQLQKASAAANRFVMTGLKKIFTPAMEKTKRIISAPEFGGVSSVTVRYPQSLPPFEKRQDLRAMGGMLDHIYHPGAILTYLMGAVTRFSYEWEPLSGASTASLRFASGAIGTLNLAAGSAPTSPLERVEVIGLVARGAERFAQRLDLIEHRQRVARALQEQHRHVARRTDACRDRATAAWPDAAESRGTPVRERPAAARRPAPATSSVRRTICRRRSAAASAIAARLRPRRRGRRRAQASADRAACCRAPCRGTGIATSRCRAPRARRRRPP